MLVTFLNYMQQMLQQKAKKKESFKNCQNTGSGATATVQQKQMHEQSTFKYNQTRNRRLFNNDLLITI